MLDLEREMEGRTKLCTVQTMNTFTHFSLCKFFSFSSQTWNHRITSIRAHTANVNTKENTRPHPELPSNHHANSTLRPACPVTSWLAPLPAVLRSTVT